VGRALADPDRGPADRPPGPRLTKARLTKPGWSDPANSGPARSSRWAAPDSPGRAEARPAHRPAHPAG
jgi:hypothetical protein